MTDDSDEEDSPEDPFDALGDEYADREGDPFESFDPPPADEEGASDAGDTGAADSDDDRPDAGGDEHADVTGPDPFEHGDHLRPDDTAGAASQPEDDTENGATGTDVSEDDASGQVGPDEASGQVGPDEASGPASADEFTDVDQPSSGGPDGPLDDGPRVDTESRGDPFAQGSPFEEVDVGGVDPDDVWDELTDAESHESVSDTTEELRSDVSKHDFCETCKYFSPPPEVHCTHEGTQILEFLDMETVRVANCPIVKERKRLGDPHQ